MQSQRTRAYLHARGLDIEAEDLPPLLEEVLSEMRRILFPDDPAADLPAAETAALRRGGFTMEPADSRPTSALARTAAEYAALRETSLTAIETARRLGVDPSRVRQLLAARKLYGLQVKGAWRIPAFQFQGEHLLPGLDEVVPALPKDLHPVGVYHWFTEPNPDLSSEKGGEHRMSPREWLLAGYPPRAVAQLATDLDSL
jgi:DNA-binding CsgD family transcriptional regulator